MWSECHALQGMLMAAHALRAVHFKYLVTLLWVGENESLKSALILFSIGDVLL